MTCSGRWAEAWQFASFFCTSSLLIGVDDSGGAGNAALTDSTVTSFIDLGVKKSVRQVLYNTTKGTHGYITDVDAHTITATGVTWDDGDAYRMVTINGTERQTISHYLDIAASDLHAAMAQSGMCDCTLASWASGFLEKLNIIDAASYYQCPCGQPTMSEETKARYMEWCSVQLEAIRMGEIDLCHGATGSEFPALGWAQQGWNEWATAEIIYDYESST